MSRAEHEREKPEPPSLLLLPEVNCYFGSRCFLKLQFASQNCLFVCFFDLISQLLWILYYVPVLLKF